MNVLNLFILLAATFEITIGICFFPVEFQGVYRSQISHSTANGHRYSEITILPDAIPVWGVCHRRVANTVVLYDSTGGMDCVRCFQLYLRSSNVLQVYTSSLEVCYTTEEAALKSCPTVSQIRDRTAKEIMLYKFESFSIDRVRRLEMCPFQGRFHFSYSAAVVSHGEPGIRNRTQMCAPLASTVETCPKASHLSFRFNECSFGYLELRLECLGSWQGINGHNYVALYDPEVRSDQQPTYRCGIYHVDPRGRVSLGLGSDATCQSGLNSPWDSYETLLLRPLTPPSPPADVYEGACRFPQWMQGTWQDLKIEKNEFVFRDRNLDLVFSSLCLTGFKPQGERFALYSLTQCGEESFTCVWVKRRAENVLEFTLGPAFTRLEESICGDEHFRNIVWTTQGRVTQPLAQCPISGEFVGTLPDDPSLCASLSSHCSHPHAMNYEVFPCRNVSIPLEERTYHCLGQWREAGITYTYTWREDVGTYECFAGVEASEDEAFVVEAGITCRRGLQPLAKGMKIVRRKTCYEMNNSSGHPFGGINSISPAKSGRGEAFPEDGGAWNPFKDRIASLLGNGSSSQMLSSNSVLSAVLIIILIVAHIL